MRYTKIFSLLLLSGTLLSCIKDEATGHYDGYVEAVSFYVAAPQSGWIDQMWVKEGDDVEIGMALVQLDDGLQKLNVEQAVANVAVATEQLKDLQTGARVEELDVAKRQLEADEAVRLQTERHYQRQQKLLQESLVSPEDVEQARLDLDVALAKEQKSRQQLSVLRLAAREHQRMAAQGQIAAQKRSVDIQKWHLEERNIVARNNGRIDQVFYRQGEFVPQGVPILSVIIPQQNKVRFYLPQAKLSEISPGQRITVSNDTDQRLSAIVSYIALNPEFTPPVLYSNENRQRLVFLIEARLDQGQGLRPGQPVQVWL